MIQREDRLWERARRYMEQGNLIAARISLESLLQRQPSHSAGNLALGSLAWAEGRVREAVAHTLLSAANAPTDNAQLRFEIALGLVRAGESLAASKLLGAVPAIPQADWRVLVNVAGLMRKLGDYATASRVMEQALAQGASGAEVQHFRSVLHTGQGRFADAEDALAECLRLNPGHAQALLDRSLLRKQEVAANHLRELEAAKARVGASSHDRALMGMARYKELEDLGRYDEAWRELAEANATLAKAWPYDPIPRRQWTARISEICTPDFLRAPPDAEIEGPQPIFIVGMPRSGTTLLDRLLGAHPLVRSVGELDDFPAQLRWMADSTDVYGGTMRRRLPDLDYAELGRRYLARTQWRAPGAAFFIDKRPLNQTFAGLIRRALPGARLLRMVRDDVAVCFSNFRTYLGETYAYSYSLDSLAEYAHENARLNSHWHAAMPGQMLDVSYADLVTDTEATMRGVIAFCGLAWNPACLDMTANPATVATPSAIRVRGRIDPGGLDEWRRYAPQLRGLCQSLAYPTPGSDTQMALNDA